MKTKNAPISILEVESTQQGKMMGSGDAWQKQILEPHWVQVMPVTEEREVQRLSSFDVRSESSRLLGLKENACYPLKSSGWVRSSRGLLSSSHMEDADPALKPGTGGEGTTGPACCLW